jgi:hypothetical protein
MPAIVNMMKARALTNSIYIRKTLTLYEYFIFSISIMSFK